VKASKADDCADMTWCDVLRQDLRKEYGSGISRHVEKLIEPGRRETRRNKNRKSQQEETHNSSK
jgi:hypothetical protein